MFRLCIPLALLLPLLLAAAEKDREDPLDNWPHWRGPLANGTAPRGKPPLKWDSKTNVAWKTPIPGKGASTPIVWGDQVFVLTAEDTKKKADPRDIPRPDPRLANTKKTNAPATYHRFIVMALDRKTGKVKWQKTCAERVPHEGHHFSHSYAGGSPTTDGKRLVASFGSFGVYCFDMGGKLLWSRDLGRMETRFGWGEAVTPVLHKDKVFINHDQEADSFITALDAKTGKDLWKVKRDEVSSWATPLVVEHGGKTQVIVPGTKRVRSYDAEDGKVIWYHDGLTVNCIPSPVAKDGMVYVMSGYRGAVAVAVPLDAKGDATEKVKWKLTDATPYVPSPLLAGERLYFTQRNEPVLSCIDIKSGKVLIDKARMRGVRQFYASPVAAAGRIYFADQDGNTLVIEQADSMKVLATNKLGEGIDASPAIVGKQMFLRGAKHVWCIEEK